MLAPVPYQLDAESRHPNFTDICTHDIKTHMRRSEMCAGGTVR